MPHAVPSANASQTLFPLHVAQEPQPAAQTPLLHVVQPVQGAQAAPFLPHAWFANPGRHVPPSQQPAHTAVQLTSWPQVFCTVPHLPAHVTASDGGRQLTGWPQLF